MAVAVLLAKAAQKDFDGLPAVVKARVAAKFADLAEYPSVSGVKALKGAHKGTFRVRVGSHRILFTLSSGTLTVVAIDDRKDVY